MNTVQIVQPILTEYRKNLFDQLGNKNYKLVINYSKDSPFGKSVNIKKKNNITYIEEGKWLNFFNLFYWQTGVKIHQSLKKGDIIIFCGSLRHLSIIPLLINAKIKSLKVVWWSHGRSIRPAPFFDKIRRTIMKYMDSVILYTEEEYRAYLEYGFKKDNVFYINNTINEEKIIKNKLSWSKENLDNFKKELGLPDDAFIFLFCGRLRSNPSTSLEVGIKAFKILVEKNKNCFYIIIGNGEKLKYFKKLVNELRLEKNILFIGEQYSEEILAPYFMISDGFLYPGYIGLSLVHALWYGLPVITHDNLLRHAPEFTILKDQHNSIKYKEFDAVDLSEKMTNLVADRGKLMKMKNNAYGSVSKNWTFKNMINNYDHAIKNLLTK